MNKAHKIVCLIFIIAYTLNIFSSHYFHSHEENHTGSVPEYSLHSHYINEDEHSNSHHNEFHFFENYYIGQYHNVSLTHIQIYFSSISLVADSFSLKNTPHSIYWGLRVQTPILLSRDNCIHSASNTSPPSA